jgi:hypothetical protein
MDEFKLLEKTGLKKHFLADGDWHGEDKLFFLLGVEFDLVLPD